MYMIAMTFSVSQFVKTTNKANTVQFNKVRYLDFLMIQLIICRVESTMGNLTIMNWSLIGLIFQEEKRN